jgi:hypothetical protein
VSLAQHLCSPSPLLVARPEAAARAERQRQVDTTLRDELIEAAGGGVVYSDRLDGVRRIRAALAASIPMDAVELGVRAACDRRIDTRNEPATRWDDPRILKSIATMCCHTKSGIWPSSKSLQERNSGNLTTARQLGQERSAHRDRLTESAGLPQDAACLLIAGKVGKRLAEALESGCLSRRTIVAPCWALRAHLPHLPRLPGKVRRGGGASALPPRGPQTWQGCCNKGRRGET